MAIAGLVHLLATEILQVGQVVGHHIVVVLVVARGQDDALGGIELHVAVGGFRNDTGHAGSIAHELLGLSVVEHLHALRGGVLGQHLHAVARVVGLRAEVDGQVVHGIPVHFLDGSRPLHRAVGNLGTLGGGQVEQPRDALAGVLRPQLYLLALAAVLMILDEARHHGLHAGRIGGVQQNARSSVALGDGRRLLLNEGDGGSGLASRNGGGHTRSAGAHDNHVVVLGLGDIGDGLGRGQEARKPLAHVTGHGGRAGGGSRRVARSGAGSGAAGRRAGAQKRSTAETRRSQAADLEQVTSSEFSSHGESFLLPLDCLRQKISGFPPLRLLGTLGPP